MFSSTLSFLMGGIIAFLLNIPMNFIEHILQTQISNRKITRIVSVFIVIMITAVFISVLMLWGMPYLWKSFKIFGERMIMWLPKIQDLIEKSDILKQMNLNLEKIVQNQGKTIIDFMFIMTRQMIKIGVIFAIGLVFAIYILVQKERLKIQMKKILFAFVRKGRAEAALEVLALANKTFTNFFVGQCKEAVILGVLFIIFMFLFQFPHAILIGITIAITALIPIFGAFVGCGIGSIVIFIDSPKKAIWFVLLFLVLQQIEGNFIYPNVVGNSVGLPGIWVLVAVSVGAAFMGILGILIFIPLASVLYALLREVIYLKLRKAHIKPEEIK